MRHMRVSLSQEGSKRALYAPGAILLPLSCYPLIIISMYMLLPRAIWAIILFFPRVCVDNAPPLLLRGFPTPRWEQRVFFFLGVSHVVFGYIEEEEEDYPWLRTEIETILIPPQPNFPHAGDSSSYYC